MEARAMLDRLYDERMCRNITELRGLEPPASREEIEPPPASTSAR